ncbi:glutamate--tRNA ligase [Patiriisocius hiemis]|uniref:Glutamate--tRNA ligase n=1 Tax=Patiriisocius hiemis TaxID=3075604 RepID=A0ABU2YBL8_9FLAO|nr:glutamate--tRNA ligase [Constantimarinum sp. W242]MDT0555589.1 glutamate--tRNA ligase [Constantimarinum sp. W242]
MSSKVRVRFAPSPTGPLHIGGVRTALFNYLFAKKHKGDFILRIEDTDQTRYVAGAEDYIIESLNWLSIPFDEGPGKDKGYGPYRQSERKHLYKEYADKLLASGNAYYAFDTAEELNEHRKSHEAEGKTFIYNWHNREKLNNSLSLSEGEVTAKIEAGEPYVIRFKSPTNQTLSLQDIVRGNIQIDTNVLDDKVLFKSDGMPTYHLANIVDDHLMEISHVIRGEEWLPSLALHVLLYQALGLEAPKFAHLPLIMKPVGKGKLSKRDGDKMGFPVFPLEWKTADGAIFSGYREDGYLPEAVINMLALLGWNPGTEQELFSLKELIEAFDLEKVNKSGAKFNPDKTKWFQQHYLQELDEDVLLERFLPLVTSKLDKEPKISEDTLKKVLAFHENDDLKFKKIIASVKERATFLSDIWEQASFYFEAPKSYNEKASAKAFKEGTKEILENVLSILESTDDYSEENLSKQIKGWITENNIGFGKVMMPLRLALVGEMKGPDVILILSILGKRASTERVKQAIDFIS